MPIYLAVCQLCGRAEDYFSSVDARDANLPTCHGKMEREMVAPMIQADIAPYMAVAGDRAGREIGSRREHREYLKRNNLREVGTDPVKHIKNDFRPAKGAIREELRHVVPDVIRRHRG